MAQLIDHFWNLIQSYSTFVLSIGQLHKYSPLRQSDAAKWLIYHTNISGLMTWQVSSHPTGKTYNKLCSIWGHYCMLYWVFTSLLMGEYLRISVTIYHSIQTRMNRSKSRYPAGRTQALSCVSHSAAVTRILLRIRNSLNCVIFVWQVKHRVLCVWSHQLQFFGLQPGTKLHGWVDISSRISVPKSVLLVLGNHWVGADLITCVFV